MRKANWKRESAIAHKLLRIPGARALFALRPHVRSGRRLDPDAELVLRVSALSKSPGFAVVGHARARATYDRMPDIFEAPPIPMPTRDITMSLATGDTLPARLYEPVAGDDRPVLLYFHGGGWVIGGGFRAHDNICRTLASRAGIAVLSVDYRLAPEAPFPAAVEDAFAALGWVNAHGRELGIDPSRLAIGGDSAGANLSIVTALRARDEGGPPIRFQLLFYPPTDVSRHYDSREHFAHGYFLDAETIQWFHDQYVGPADPRDPRISPLCADSLAGLPPAHVVTAGFDPLSDEGEALALRLAREGVPTSYRCYEGQIHGFLQMAGVIEAARHALDDAARRLRAHLA